MFEERIMLDKLTGALFWRNLRVIAEISIKKEKKIHMTRGKVLEF